MLIRIKSNVTCHERTQDEAAHAEAAEQRIELPLKQLLQVRCTLTNKPVEGPVCRRSDRHALGSVSQRKNLWAMLASGGSVQVIKTKTDASIVDSTDSQGEGGGQREQNPGFRSCQD
jgi:hypothetical protein